MAEKGRHFDCSKCKVHVQEARRCNEDNWEHEPGGQIPIVIMDGLPGHSFCPAKLFRDDMEFARHLRYLWLCWKMHLSPSGDALDRMSEEDAETLATLINMSEEYARLEDFRRLGRLLGGDPQKPSKKTGDQGQLYIQD